MHTLRRSSIALLVAACLLAGCSGSGPAGPFSRPPGDPGTRWVLFLGNSHTYVNDLPGMLVQLAALAGDNTLRAESIVAADYALEDHWAVGAAQVALERYDWDYVVMQQGPSSLPESQVHLAYWTAQFAPLIRAAGAEPVLYQIWPSAWRRMDAANALLSYTNAAAAIDGILAPAGDAFTAAIDGYPLIHVYSGDGLHASTRGTYVAALTLLGRLNDVDPRTLPLTIPGASTPSDTVRMLQEAAAIALLRNPARP